MAKAAVGANVMFCGHKGYFLADIRVVGNVNVVIASGHQVTPENLIRTGLNSATHVMVDFPTPGVWRPLQGIFVVPESQVKELKNER